MLASPHSLHTAASAGGLHAYVASDEFSVSELELEAESGSVFESDEESVSVSVAVADGAGSRSDGSSACSSVAAV
ncbi:hypothetical protein C484_17551 [Natrialba taiwanensis DSM 12281]|uniref:Uncharacterized protein n=1 Tax=Natrialba taiwanensis DSM 12281 TaxID=1230458 RepID=L9ZLG3_9EURY|nr:hypothetical protein C484_17551 [Natrialba taiwanensis DSM 12281]